MSQFYQRYFPSGKNAKESKTAEKAKQMSENGEVNEQRGQKRRREVERSEDAQNFEAQSQSPKNREHDGSNQNIDGAKSILDKYSISTFAKSRNEKVDIVPRKTPKKDRKRDGQPSISTKDNNGAIQLSEHEQATLGNYKNENPSRKHSAILQKYTQSRQVSEPNQASSGEDSAQEGLAPSESYGLFPIPQPEAQAAAPFKLSYSTLPSWQANATRVRRANNLSFSELGLSANSLSNLASHNIKKPFKVQSTIIPLLMAGPQAHNDDLCISAATGSGKTLAYVLPIVEKLSKRNKPGLGAVIVVPTRELVKQVKETCEVCAAGTSLIIATAAGSKSLSAEQSLLVETKVIYDSDAYQKELNTPIDWTTFSLEKTLQRARNRDPSKIVNYVQRTTIKPDILITTPGRLVDHLQSTDGFHLDDVEWLVIDEADRLLNESYQEWVDSVKPALSSRGATKEYDRVLSHMRLQLPPRVVRKILLSATMTTDISKLNRIGLTNPRLIVFESEDGLDQISTVEVDTEEAVHDSTGKFVLPAALHEFAVPIKEGSAKPLFLLQLLKDHLRISSTDPSGATIDDSSPEDTSDSSSEGSESDEESSSSSDSDTSSSASSTAHAGKHNHNPSLPRSNNRSGTNESLVSAGHVVRSLIFTRSTASASRLSRLLSLLSPALSPLIATLTRSTISSASSRKALASFRAGKTPILIATDRASRGIDIPGLEHVVSYDVPGSALTYVHRVGRTARAGREGNAWTIVEHREGKWFWHDIGGKASTGTIQRAGKIRKITIQVDDEELQKRYEDALQTLGSEVRGE